LIPREVKVDGGDVTVSRAAGRGQWWLGSVNNLWNRMVAARSEAGVEVVAQSETWVKAVACSEAGDEAAVCSGPRIEDGKRWQHDGI
jgi:hypothetical protein